MYTLPAKFLEFISKLILKQNKQLIKIIMINEDVEEYEDELNKLIEELSKPTIF